MRVAVVCFKEITSAVGETTVVSLQPEFYSFSATLDHVDAPCPENLVLPKYHELYSLVN